MKRTMTYKIKVLNYDHSTNIIFFRVPKNSPKNIKNSIV